MDAECSWKALHAALCVRIVCASNISNITNGRSENQQCPNATQMNSRNQSRRANRDDIIAPNNCYRCRGEDMWISIAINTDEEWEKFCHLTGHPQWLEDVRFCDAYNRQIHQEELDRIIESWTVEYTDYELMDMLQKGGIAAMPSLNTEQLDTDPHLKERDVFVQVEHPVIGKDWAIAPPWRLSATPAGIKRHSPLLGEHNDFIFHGLLGMSREEIKELEEEQVIY